MVKKVSPTFSTRRSCLILVLATALLALVLSQLLEPVRHWAGDRFLARGDADFIAHKYDEAQEEYKRAWHTDGNNTVAREREKLAQSAIGDIASARSFFVDHGDTETVEKIDRATSDYATAKEALAAGVEFFAQGDYAYARYPLEKAVAMDAAYPEAWNYLGQTYEKLALVDATYRDKVQDAFAKRDALTAKWR